MDIKTKDNIIDQLNSAFPCANFAVIQKPDSIDLICDNKEVYYSDEYITSLCRIISRELNDNERAMLAVRYDHFDEVKY